MLVYQNLEALVKLLCSATGAVAECREMHTCSEEKLRSCCGCKSQAPVRTGQGLCAGQGLGPSWHCQEMGLPLPAHPSVPAPAAVLPTAWSCSAAPDTPEPHLAGPRGTQGCADNASPKETGQGHNSHQAQLLPLVITWQSCFQRDLQGLGHCCLTWFGGEQEHGELFSVSQRALFFCSSFV